MTRRVPRTRERLAELASLGLWTAPEDAAALLDEAEALPPSTDDVLVHGDLHVRHVLVGSNGVPTAVIDWGDLAVADPSVDLSLYWSQLDAPARTAFREAYGWSGPAGAAAAGRVLALFLDAALAAYAHAWGTRRCCARRSTGWGVRSATDAGQRRGTSRLTANGSFPRSMPL